MAPLDSLKNQSVDGAIRLIAALLLLAVMVVLGYALRHTLSCFLLSFVIAYLLDPVVLRFEGVILTRMQAIIMLYVILGLLSTFAIIYLVPFLTISWEQFVTTLPANLTKIKQAVTDLQTSQPTYYGSEEITWLLNTLLGNADKMVQKAGAWAYGFATGIFFNVFNLILAPILVFFMLNYKHKIIELFIVWTPLSRLALLNQITREIDSSIGGYLRGQIFVSLLVAIVTVPALMMLGIPYAIPCGIFAGIASILPFIGVVLAMLPALLMTWLSFGSGVMLVEVLAVFSVIYFFEGYLVKPLVFRESMNLNPLLTIIMVMAFGEIMGFWGILLALPITAALKIASQHWLKGHFSSYQD